MAHNEYPYNWNLEKGIRQIAVRHCGYRGRSLNILSFVRNYPSPSVRGAGGITVGQPIGYAKWYRPISGHGMLLRAPIVDIRLPADR